MSPYGGAVGREGLPDEGESGCTCGDVEGVVERIARCASTNLPRAFKRHCHRNRALRSRSLPRQSAAASCVGFFWGGGRKWEVGSEGRRNKFFLPSAFRLSTSAFRWGGACLFSVENIQ